MKKDKSMIRKATRETGRHRKDARSVSIEAEFMRFIEFHKARRLSRNLRSLLLEFLMHDGSFEAIYLRELMYDLNGLFILLDEIEAGQVEDEIAV